MTLPETNNAERLQAKIRAGFGAAPIFDIQDAETALAELLAQNTELADEAAEHADRAIRYGREARLAEESNEKLRAQNTELRDALAALCDVADSCDLTVSDEEAMLPEIERSRAVIARWDIGDTQ